jgi:hypothetical protein
MDRERSRRENKRDRLLEVITLKGRTTALTTCALLLFLFFSFSFHASRAFRLLLLAVCFARGFVWTPSACDLCLLFAPARIMTTPRNKTDDNVRKSISMFVQTPRSSSPIFVRPCRTSRAEPMSRSCPTAARRTQSRRASTGRHPPMPVPWRTPPAPAPLRLLAASS